MLGKSRCARLALTCVCAFALALVLGGAVPALAADVPGPIAGAPGLAAKGKFVVGIDGVWAFEERFKDATEQWHDSYGDSGSQTASSVKVVNDRLIMARLTYGLTDWLSVYGRLGYAEGGSLRETLRGLEWQAQMKPALVWALGARGRAFEQPNGLGLTLGAEYLRYDNRKIGQWRYPDGSSTADYATTVDGNFDYWRAQADATLYWKLGRFTPYLGAQFLYSELKLDERWTSPWDWSAYNWDVKNQDNLGCFAGLAIALAPRFNLDLRANFISRSEGMIGFSYEF